MPLAVLNAGQLQRGEHGPAATGRAKTYILEYATVCVKQTETPLCLVPSLIFKSQENVTTLGLVADVKVVKGFVSDVFTGAVVETDLGLDDLKGLPGVVNVWPNNQVNLKPSAQEQNCKEVRAARPRYFAHNATGVSKLHERGIFGKGVKVGVVVTGIWYKHDALGGGFGKGFKVAGGYDFVGNGDYQSPENERQPGEDPLDLSGHGTSVAGIIAGKANDFLGVAPEATLYAYKVFGGQGGTGAATLIEAFLAAYYDGVDIITASVAAPSGWAEEAWAVVASRMVSKGIVVTIAAGNEGSDGPFDMRTAASGKNVLAVAMADTLRAKGTCASSKTSWDLLNDLGLKPDIAAPGTSLKTTAPDNRWTTASGTSISCPYVAGVAALYIGEFGGRRVHGERFALDLSRRIISTARRLAYHDSKYADLAAPVAQVGNGQVDALKLFDSTTALEFEPIALNDTRHFKGRHEIIVKNYALVAVRYHLSSQDAYGVDTLQLNCTNGSKTVKRLSQLVPRKLAVKVGLPGDFTLKPRHIKRVSVDFKNPNALGWNAAALPLYSGKIIVSGDNGDELSVPYAGVGADLRKEVSPLSRPGYPYMVYVNPTSYVHYSWPCDLWFTSQDFSRIYDNSIWGTRELRWDISEAGWTEEKWAYPPVAGENGFVGSGTYMAGGRWDTNNTLPYPKTNLARSKDKSEHWWTGKLADGSQIAAGNYT
ncbi:subtilase [Colletotrichum plurivorum]|uniref:Subtilase n=1 Tax=Colletotrichum plurivorum TaxID=2175906 RepID=A0A8H6KSK7_9PEZI|nr:subtilase [Colletotrichum plurivorum]